MRLSDIVSLPGGGDDPEIRGVTQDSRQVRPGFLFAALPGRKYDGRAFIADAIRNGAVAILGPAGTLLPADDTRVSLVVSDNPHRDLALAAAGFYRLQPVYIAAVTGTNGKTSTVHFTRQLWQMAGLEAASLGTLGVRGAGMTRPGAMTTPDPVALHAMVADMAAAGVTHLALEASSHGLDQFRLDGLTLSAAGFTNLSRDHLDYHEDMAGYLAAKARLFSDLLRDGGAAVLNADVPEYEALHAIVKSRGLSEISYGFQGDGIKLIALDPKPDGQDVTLQIDGMVRTIHLPLVGAFQAMNVLCAVGLAMAENKFETDRIFDFLPALKRPPGRLELIPGHPTGAVYVDYAHTPDALAMVLRALRPHTPGRLICLFGCGGDRDKGKRPLMGSIATDLADHVIVTDDNPRGEDPAAIRAAVLAGGGTGAREVDDRRDAIKAGVEMLAAGDVLLVAGKGHEEGQIFQDRVDPFNDADEVRKAIKEM
ncbi:MAG: UDP-N-acetylmuramoyl-L-alanyl-D-glutamate--2,6-diaminopimelate ligase [Alphaproteobacteria bacterium]|nr:UDP-N-acetylmuramoyl-L-alanyl-D-glutamate--2,6-diaminopimelate ligase [Alphaproteobacteria bacterium]